MSTTRKYLTVALAAVVAVSLAACGSSSGGASGSGKTVSVDVGLAKPVKLSAGKLKIAIMMNDTSNEWEQSLANSAKATAEKYGWTADILNPGFDVQKQLNQVQTAVSTHKYDAIVAIPVDGKLTCNAFTKQLPAANILVSIGAVQMCDNGLAEGDDLWTKGTLNWVGGTGTSAQYIRSWLSNAAKLNPGPQKAVLLAGPEVLTVTNTTKTILKEFAKTNPDFDVQDLLYTDFTTPDTYKKTLDYLRAHPDITVVLSTYSPDMTRGAIQALKQLNLLGKIKIADSGGAKYTFEQIQAGNIQFTSPLFPKKTGEYMVESIKSAQDGKTPKRFISDIPPELGTPDDIPIFTKENMDTFTPEF